MLSTKQAVSQAFMNARGASLSKGRWPCLGAAGAPTPAYGDDLHHCWPRPVPPLHFAVTRVSYRSFELEWTYISCCEVTRFGVSVHSRGFVDLLGDQLLQLDEKSNSNPVMAVAHEPSKYSVKKLSMRSVKKLREEAVLSGW